MIHSKTNRSIYCIALTISIIIGLLLLYQLKIKGIIRLDCVTYKYFKILCPACGVTRMVRAFLNRDIALAFRYNQVVFMSIPYIIYTYYVGCAEYIKHNTLNSNKLAHNLVILVFILISWGIIRNIPGLEIFSPNSV